MSSAASSVAGGQQMNMISSRMVQKLAIEGRCQAEDEGASLRLFMKARYFPIFMGFSGVWSLYFNFLQIVLPLDGLIGGSSIPLFPEVGYISSR